MDIYGWENDSVNAVRYARIKSDSSLSIFAETNQMFDRADHETGFGVTFHPSLIIGRTGGTFYSANGDDSSAVSSLCSSPTFVEQKIQGWDGI